MLLTLLLYQYSCNYVKTNHLGAEMFTTELEKGETLCMNISYYPTFVIFENFAKDTKFDVIKHYPVTESPELRKSTYIRYLNNYISILEPFAQIIFTAESSDLLSFTVLSIPGMCDDGIFFTTKTKNQIILSTEGTGFNKIAPFSDKCVFKSVPGETNVSISYETDSNWSQVFIYDAFDDFYSLSNDDSHSFNTASPLFYRVLVGEHSNYNKVTVSFDSDDELAGYMPREDYFYFEEIVDYCESEKTWATQEIAIIVLTVCIILLIIVLLWLGMLCIEKNVKAKKKQFFSVDSMSLTSGEASLYTSISALYQ